MNVPDWAFVDRMQIMYWPIERSAVTNVDPEVKFADATGVTAPPTTRRMDIVELYGVAVRLKTKLMVWKFGSSSLNNALNVLFDVNGVMVDGKMLVSES